jgi:tetratricopeptide (TPR) repeat protein
VRAALGDLLAAAEAAEEALGLAPHAPEVLQLVGLLRLENKSAQNAREVLDLAVMRNAKDSYSWLALASALERSVFIGDPAHDHGLVRRAIQAYTKAAKLELEHSSRVPYEVLNNIGVLHLWLDELIPAQSAFIAALKNIERLSLAPDAALPKLDPHILLPPEVGSVHGDGVGILWKPISGGVWYVPFDRHILWIDTAVGPPYHSGERIRVGDGDDSCIVSVRDTLPLESAAHTLELSTYKCIAKRAQKNALVIHISEPLRNSENSSAPVNLPLCRIESKIVIDDSSVPICINAAQLYTRAGDMHKAHELARLATSLAPDNIRCRLLLASLAFATKDIEEARTHIASTTKIGFELLNKCSDSVMLEQVTDSLSVASFMWCELGDYNEALKILVALQGVINTGERRCSSIYADVTLCHLHLDSLSSRSAPEIRAQQLKDAADCARSALMNESSCVAAAHALGVIMLELGRLNDATVIFERMQERSIASEPAITTHSMLRGGPAISHDSQRGACFLVDAAINLAHSHLLAGQSSEAVAGYTTCVKIVLPMLVGEAIPPSIQASRADLHHWLARARYGTHDDQGARRALASAIHMQPMNFVFRCHCIARVEHSRSLKYSILSNL